MSGYIEIFDSQQLLVVDQEPIISEARDAFERAYQSIAQLKSDLHQHENEDVPAYSQWVSATFGRLITQTRELTALLREKEVLLAQAREKHWSKFFGNSAPFESGMGRAEEHVHQSFCNMHANWRVFEDAGPDEFGPEHEEYIYQEVGGSYDDEQEQFYSEDESYSREFERLFRRRSEEGYGFSGRSYSAGTDRGRSGTRYAEALERSDETAARELSAQEQLLMKLKDTYRALVRKLHPDLNAGLTAEEKSIWHQVQSAYQARNLEQLELLLALANVFSGKLTADTSLSQIRRATREVERLLAPLRKKLAEARRNRAWKFTEILDRSELERAVENDLRRELAEIRHRLTQLDVNISRFSAQQYAES